MALIETLVNDFSTDLSGFTDTSIPTGTAAIVSSKLHLDSGDAASDKGAITSTAKYELTDSGVWFKLDPYTPNNDAHFWGGIFVDPAPHFYGHWIRFDGELRFYSGSSGHADAVAYNSTTHAWLGMFYDGTDLLWRTAPDSAGAPGTWVTRRSVNAIADYAAFDADNVAIQFEQYYIAIANYTADVSKLNYVAPGGGSVIPASNHYRRQLGL